MKAGKKAVKTIRKMDKLNIRILNWNANGIQNKITN